MCFDYSKLKGRIIEMYGNQGAFAVALGVSKNTLSKKMQNKIRFTSSDIIKITEMLNIPKEEIGNYFFCKDSLTLLNKLKK